MGSNENIVGLIPACGNATRISTIPFSKELIPIGFEIERNKERIQVVSQELIKKMSMTGVSQIYFLLLNSKFDVIKYYSNNNYYKNLAFIFLPNSPNVPFTISESYSFIKNKIVLFGFPDIIIRPNDVYPKLVNHLKITNCDIVLGLFPVKNPVDWHMIEFSENEDISNIILKPISSNLKYTWLVSVWNSNFTKFIKENVLKRNNQKHNSISGDEYTISELIVESIKEGIEIKYLKFTDGKAIDIGTYNNLKNYFATKI